MGKSTQINVEIDIICENMCEEGSESNSGYEEGLNVFRNNFSSSFSPLYLLILFLLPCKVFSFYTTDKISSQSVLIKFCPLSQLSFRIITARTLHQWTLLQHD